MLLRHAASRSSSFNNAGYSDASCTLFTYTYGFNRKPASTGVAQCFMGLMLETSHAHRQQTPKSRASARVCTWPQKQQFGSHENVCKQQFACRHFQGIPLLCSVHLSVHKCRISSLCCRCSSFSLLASSATCVQEDEESCKRVHKLFAFVMGSLLIMGQKQPMTKAWVSCTEEV